MATKKFNPTQEVYAELQQAYEHFNRHLFNDELPGALITLQREKDTFGYFSHNRFVARTENKQVDEIALNPSYFAVVPIVEVLQTLAHEMTHQWQIHLGNPGRRRYHNHEWANKMESIGLMPSHNGLPGGKRVGEKMADYAMEGGPFLRACQSLITDSFTISWLDRFPSPKQVAMASCLPSVKLPPEAGGGMPPIGAVAPPSFATNGGASNSALLSASAALGAPVGSQPSSMSAAVVMPTEPKAQTRVRYQCQCVNRVWGRPGLRIVCADCDCEFVVG